MIPKKKEGDNFICVNKSPKSSRALLQYACRGIERKRTDSYLVRTQILASYCALLSSQKPCGCNTTFAGCLTASQRKFSLQSSATYRDHAEGGSSLSHIIMSMQEPPSMEVGRFKNIAIVLGDMCREFIAK